MRCNSEEFFSILPGSVASINFIVTKKPQNSEVSYEVKKYILSFDDLVKVTFPHDELLDRASGERPTSEVMKTSFCRKYEV